MTWMQKVDIYVFKPILQHIFTKWIASTAGLGLDEKLFGATKQGQTS